MVSHLRWMVGPEAEPDEKTWQDMGQALWRGDALADELVAWMHSVGMARGWGTFEKALAARGEGAQDLPQPLRQYIEATQQWPDWVDADKLQRGARALQCSGLHGMMVLRDAGLMAGYQASAINKTLVMTGSLAKGAQRRVAETTVWWLACTEDDGMKPGAPGFQMTLRVRLMHALVRHKLSRSPDWDADELGLPINQLDMQATYLAFSVVQLIALKTTGVWMTPAESEAVMHLWRYIGWLMGVEEDLLCHTEKQGRIALYRNLLSQAPADESSVQLARALHDEPLFRHYRNWPRLRGQLNKARHLAIVSWFVGAEGLKALGLPYVPPWYPALMLGPLAARSTFAHLAEAISPGSWASRARQVQRGYLDALTGEKAPHHLMGDVPHREAGRMSGMA